MRHSMIIAVAASSLLLSACASTPPESLVELKQKLDSLESNEQTNRFAPVALKEAQDQVRTTESAWNKDNEALYDHELYLAERYIEIAEQETERGEVQAKLGNTSERRKEMILSQQEKEMERARLEAREAKEKLEALKTEMENVKAEQTDRGLILTMGDVLFALNSAELQPGGEKNIEKLANFMHENVETQVTVEGFTDSLGSEQYNEKLSEKRAQSVVDLLEASNIDSSRLNIKAYGERYPVATNDTAAGRQQNRRVQLVINNQSDRYQGPKADESGMQTSSN